MEDINHSQRSTRVIECGILPGPNNSDTLLWVLFEMCVNEIVVVDDDDVVGLGSVCVTSFGLGP